MSGDAGRRDASSVESEATAAEELTDALENADALAWASMELWTDVSVRSKPEVLKLAIKTLEQAVDAEEHSRKSNQLKTRVGAAAIVAASVGAVGAVVGLVTVNQANHKSVLGFLLAIFIGILGFLIGMLASRRTFASKEKDELDLTRKVLNYEIEYQKQISEADLQS